MANTYFLTGGAGNLACQLTFELATSGGRVVLFDWADEPVGLIAEGCQYVRGDLTNTEQVRAALRDAAPQTIVHLASLLSGRCEQDRALAWRVNADGAFALFESALELGIGQFFFPSSLASFGGTLPDPLPEDYPQWPVGFYGVTKVVCEHLGVYYHERHGLDFRCLRLPIVVSKHSHTGAASAYASQTFIQAVRHGRYVCKVRPSTRCSVIYACDVVRAMAQLIRAPVEKLTRRIYTVHGLAPTAEQIAEAVRARLDGVEIRFEPEPAVADLVDSWPAVLEDASARRDWGWQPHYDLDTMADDFIEELRREAGNAPRV